MVIMQYISVFFSGFILSKLLRLLSLRQELTPAVRLPFPLTAGFKSLLSKDIIMPDLDAQWVS